MTAKTVLALHPSFRDDIADLVTRRPLPGPGLAQVDPFLFLNHHGPQTYPPGNRGLPFGPHPHRGFETVTFILDGELAHRDSAGHESVVGAGGVQWMTAGRGIVHAELSPDSVKAGGGDLEILQLWVNLPGRLKMCPPGYTGLQAADLPILSLDGGRVTFRPVSGTWADRSGPIRSQTGVSLCLLGLQPGGRTVLDGLTGRNLLLYAVRGAATVNGTLLPRWHLAGLDTEGDRVELAADEPALLLCGHADPIGEPVVAHGPFVMNTRQEIQDAIRDYQAGRFD